MGKWICCGIDCLKFRPHIGFRLADIRERFKDRVKASGVILFDEIYSTASFRHENRFKGIGLRIGLDTELAICEEVSLIGRGAASAVWGTTHLKNGLKVSSAAVYSQYRDSIKDNYRQTRFFTDLSLGVRWKTIACCCYPFTVDLAWEHHYLFAQHRYWVDNNFATSAPSTGWKNSSDMALQGLTSTAGFDF